MRRGVVLDTNVAIVANGQTPHAGLGCEAACVERLDKIRREEKLLLDNGRSILKEYLKSRLSLSGQPGSGDAFFKWVWDHQGRTDLCHIVTITPCATREYMEFPASRELRDFDRDDRKFVAVAIASGMSPSILNATDTDWRDYRKALEKHGVQIEFVCPALMRDNQRKNRSQE